MQRTEKTRKEQLIYFISGRLSIEPSGSTALFGFLSKSRVNCRSVASGFHVCKCMYSGMPGNLPVGKQLWFWEPFPVWLCDLISHTFIDGDFSSWTMLASLANDHTPARSTGLQCISCRGILCQGRICPWTRGCQ